MHRKRAIKTPLPACALAAGLAAGAGLTTDLIFGRIGGWGWPLQIDRSDV